MSNTIGTLLKLTTFGESHGVAFGGIIDGCPSGIKLDMKAIQHDLDRRRPGQSKLVTARDEKDEVQFLSGIFEGITTGTPIGFLVPNTNSKSSDYSHLKDTYRPSHADFVYQQKYGIRDHNGGGRSSARETVNWVVAGAIAKQIIPAISIQAYVSSVGNVILDKPYGALDLTAIETNDVRCPDATVAKQMEALIKEVKKQGDTVGGTITCVVKNVPIGIGEPVFNKLQADLGKAMLSINAVKGFEYGSGFQAATLLGSQHNDLFHENGTTQTNYSGGIQGGISNGMEIYFKVAFKPVATLLQEQEVLTASGALIIQQGKGRHDACVVPRAVPIVEALTALVLADNYMLKNVNVIK